MKQVIWRALWLLAGCCASTAKAMPLELSAREWNAPVPWSQALTAPPGSCCAYLGDEEQTISMAAARLAVPPAPLPVPEPGQEALLLLGVALLLVCGRRRERRAPWPMIRVG